MDTPPLIHPGHTLTIYPPLSVVNLLPFDVQLQLSGRERGRMVRKGEKLSHYDVSRWGHLHIYCGPDHTPCLALWCTCLLGGVYVSSALFGSVFKWEQGG